MINLLTYSTLYPNAVTPHHGIFVETRLRHLLASGEVTSRVVAPVPWFPRALASVAGWGGYSKVPKSDRRREIDIVYPRYPVLPKVGMTIAPSLLYAGSVNAVVKVARNGPPVDVLDAHYFYPDGVAAVAIGRKLGVPVTITARGTDINLIPKYNLARRQILWAAKHASHMITVCQALKDEMVDLGVEADRITVLRNGVDLNLFRPHDRDAARAKHDIPPNSIISVGHLIERKAHDLIIGALPDLPGVTLLIAGGGEERENLERQARDLDVAERVRFLGPRPQSDLPELLSACDALVLASSREGWANVLLESMACGTPVAASNVWGTPEIVATPEAGRLLEARTSPAIAAAVKEILADPPDRAATRAYAERFSWDDTTQGQIELFSRLAR